MTAPDPAALEAAREEAWSRYNAVQRALPDCEHVKAWLAETGRAREEFHAAIRACDKAASSAAGRPAAVAPPAPADMPPVTVLEQAPLFDLPAKEAA